MGDLVCGGGEGAVEGDLTHLSDRYIFPYKGIVEMGEGRNTMKTLWPANRNILIDKECRQQGGKEGSRVHTLFSVGSQTSTQNLSRITKMNERNKRYNDCVHSF